MPVHSQSLHEQTSFWARDYGPYTPNAPMAADTTADVAVIGGGFTGLSTALEFKRDNPAARVVVLEGAVVGYGASGRNGGFSMKLFGMEPEVTRLRWGDQRTIEAHRYSQRAVAHVKRLIEENHLDSDYRHTGMLRVSYTPRQLKRLENTFGLFQKLGIDDDMSLRAKGELSTEFRTDRFLGAIQETETGILNPCKHVRELKRLAEKAGVEVYEETPVIGISRSGSGVVVAVPGATVRADKLVIATNAYTRELPGLPALRSKQVPIWTFQIVTEPLGAKLWADLGWEKRQSFEDNRQLVHYFRPTVDGRITMGGGDVGAPIGAGFDHDFAPGTWKHCEAHLKWIWPRLKDIRVEYRWGGPVSVNTDMTPEIGFVGDERVIYSVGCIGHGVSLSHLNGRLIADLLSGSKSELTEFWIVNRKSIPWPPEPLSFVGKQVLCAGLRIWDRFEERGLAGRAG